MSIKDDLTGKRFWHLIVLERSDYVGSRLGYRWKCLCDCGNTVELPTSKLTNGIARTCGCRIGVGRKRINKPKEENYKEKQYKVARKGDRFHRLTVFDECVWKTPTGDRVCKCICDCGNITYVPSHNLTSGNTKSCGCYRRELLDIGLGKKHGLSKSKIYLAYKKMLNSGITVCNEWIGESGVFAFHEWAIKNGWQKGLSLCRMDENGIYEPSNCEWKKISGSKPNIYIEIDGESHSLTEWSEIYGIKRITICKRMNDYGWSAKDAVTKPVYSQYRSRKEKSVDIS